MDFVKAYRRAGNFIKYRDSAKISPKNSQKNSAKVEFILKNPFSRK